MSPDVPSCQSAAHAKCMYTTWRQALAATVGPIAGKCRKACSIMQYTLQSVPVAGGRACANESRLMAYYSNFEAATTTEYLIYDFGSIVAAVGGSLDLFLGFSCHDGAKRLLGILA